jgi:hypothetical protein
MMAGCKSCSDCAPKTSFKSVGKAEKLEVAEHSGNPRYPHVIVGKQAIYSDDHVQMIVTVMSDDCDENCDCFTLQPRRILKELSSDHLVEEVFTVSQPADRRCWKLHALI